MSRIKYDQHKIIESVCVCEDQLTLQTKLQKEK